MNRSSNRTRKVRPESGWRRFPVLIAAGALLVCARPVRADPGPEIPVDGVRPAAMTGLLRHWPLAVHAAAGTRADEMQGALGDAYELLTDLRVRFALPDPVPDGTRGGGPELDVYLVDPDVALTAAGGSDARHDTFEYAALWDRASSFVVVDRTLGRDSMRHALALGIARALLRGIDARMPRPLEFALAETYARRLSGEPLAPSALAAFQHTSDAALLRDRDDLSARGASLLTDYLAQRFDRADLLGLSALAWMPVAHTPAERDHLVPEPHVFDVLERTLRDERGGMRGVLADFTVARALLGTGADTLGYPGIGLDPDDIALRPVPWIDVAMATLPAWITPRAPIDETGAFFAAVDTRDAGEHGIDLWLHGMPWREWVVTVLRLGSDGTLVGTLPRTPVVRGEWNTIVENLDRTARLLVVVNDFGNGHLDPYEGPSRNGVFQLHIARR
jgi:hypothetical protein